MGSLERVPCFHVCRENIDEIWPQLVSDVENATWVAMDLEFSGIGEKENFKIKEIDVRYKVLSQLAKTRSIVSIGFSIFKRIDKILLSEEGGDGTGHTWRYHVANYDMICQCDDPYVTDLDAHAFLLNHGFDFERQRNFGVPYKRGAQNDDLASPTIRNVFLKLVQHKVPIAFHNGFLDLIFLYQNFYSELPSDLQVLLSDLRDMFPRGIYDTKYVAENAGSDVSFLEFVYYERQRSNVQRLMKRLPNIHVNFSDHFRDREFREVRNMKTTILDKRPPDVEVCTHYSLHGWCNFGIDCIKSHDIDFILDRRKTGSKQKSRSRQRMSKLIKLSKFNEGLADQVIPVNEGAIVEEASLLGRVKSGAHRSGYDAFMTGYAFGAYLLKYWENDPCAKILEPTLPGVRDVANRIYLSGKEQALRIRSSGFAKCSNEHKMILQKLRNS
ncbi:Target of EGR1 protein 1 [Halotydeus destructor]|nr:Target of EGR1 protein 1 [Halotydeus destructor]